MQISKSEYMMFLRHPAWIWLKKHEKYKLPPIDEDTQAMFDAGFLFESYAEKMFPGATKLGFNTYYEYLSLAKRTAEAINRGDKYIVQAKFETAEIACICDIIVNIGDNVFDLYEIKSSTSVKPEHKLDLAFQKETITNAGYKINNMFVIHVDTEYIRNGNIETNKLCKIVNVTDEVNELENFTKENIQKAIEIINQKECPDISPRHAGLNSYNDWLAIYKTLAEIDEYSIYDLCASNAEKIGDLESLNIKYLNEIPEEFVLNEKQMRQVMATKKDEILIDKIKIAEFLSDIKFPLYFLDYETLSSVVPYFDGIGPYEQLPFQYSLHVLESPDSELKHYHYLHDNKENPVVPLTESLKSHIDDNGTILVWFEGFEKNRNKLMGKMFPEYEKFYEDINERVIDLMRPFADGAYVHKDFLGSASIKKVLPILVPELSYNELNIHAGGAAQRLWMDAILYDKNNKKDEILQDLLKYCELDTLAMVRIYQFLNKI